MFYFHCQSIHITHDTDLHGTCPERSEWVPPLVGLGTYLLVGHCKIPFAVARSAGEETRAEIRPDYIYIAWDGCDWEADNCALGSTAVSGSAAWRS